MRISRIKYFHDLVMWNNMFVVGVCNFGLGLERDKNFSSKVNLPYKTN